MAEAFLNFQDQRRTSSPSRSLPDFEEEWLQLGQEFSVIFDSGNSPVDQSQEKPRKRRLSEAEDSLIISRSKMARKGFTQQRSQEDPQIKKLRQEKPMRYEALEKRTKTRDTAGTTVSQKYQFRPASPPATMVSPKISLELPTTTLMPPKYSPSSPGYCPESSRQDQFFPKPEPPTYSPSSPGYCPESSRQDRFFPKPEPPKYSPSSPGYCPESSRQDRFFPKPEPPTYSPSSPGNCPESSRQDQFFPKPEPTLFGLPESAQHPLKNELGALLELVNSVRVDLLQTSMLVTYIMDFIEKNWK